MPDFDLNQFGYELDRAILIAKISDADLLVYLHEDLWKHIRENLHNIKVENKSLFDSILSNIFIYVNKDVPYPGWQFKLRTSKWTIEDARRLANPEEKEQNA